MGNNEKGTRSRGLRKVSKVHDWKNVMERANVVLCLVGWPESNLNHISLHFKGHASSFVQYCAPLLACLRGEGAFERNERHTQSQRALLPPHQLPSRLSAAPRATLFPTFLQILTLWI